MGLILDALERTTHIRGPGAPALRHKQDGRWHTITWGEYRERVHLAGRALIAMGLAAGEHVVIIGFNCPEWFIADVGAIVAGLIPSGIYTTSSTEQCRWIADHCDARVAFVENEEQLAKFLEIRASLPKLRAIVLMHGETSARDVLGWNQFLDMGRTVLDHDVEARAAAQRPDDVCTMIYTSGTTGVPKAVMLTHRNLVWVVETAGRLAGVRPGDEMISYLPLSHVAELCFSLIANLVLGTTISFAESLDLLGDAMKEVRPHHFLAVPRVWEKIQARMEAAGAAAPPVRRRIVAWARGIGLRGGYAMQQGKRPPLLYPLADLLVFRKVRQALGLDRTRTLISGAAPIARNTLEFFLSLGLPICEIYGMSETTAVITISTPRHNRTGKAGRVLAGTELRFADDGEILVRGPNVFKGYYKDDALGSEVLDADGWLHTGDIGTMDADGFVEITDRKKELIITAGGENIAPSLIEAHLKSVHGVQQAVVVGDKRRFLAALIVLDPAKLPTLAAAAGVPVTTLAEAASSSALVEYVQRQIDVANRSLARVQTVKRIALLTEEFSIEGGELTPSLKLKRRVVNQKYATIIERLYATEAS